MPKTPLARLMRVLVHLGGDCTERDIRRNLRLPPAAIRDALADALRLGLVYPVNRGQHAAAVIRLTPAGIWQGIRSLPSPKPLKGVYLARTDRKPPVPKAAPKVKPELLPTDQEAFLKFKRLRDARNARRLAKKAARRRAEETVKPRLELVPAALPAAGEMHDRLPASSSIGVPQPPPAERILESPVFREMQERLANEKSSGCCESCHATLAECRCGNRQLLPAADPIPGRYVQPAASVRPIAQSAEDPRIAKIRREGYQTQGNTVLYDGKYVSVDEWCAKMTHVKL